MRSTGHHISSSRMLLPEGAAARRFAATGMDRARSIGSRRSTRPAATGMYRAPHRSIRIRRRPHPHRRSHHRLRRCNRPHPQVCCRWQPPLASEVGKEGTQRLSVPRLGCPERSQADNDPAFSSLRLQRVQWPKWPARPGVEPARSAACEQGKLCSRSMYIYIYRFAALKEAPFQRRAAARSKKSRFSDGLPLAQRSPVSAKSCRSLK